MAPETSYGISQVIQQSVAPVFLLAGIGAFIGVSATRLGRIFDRSRELERLLETSSERKKEDINAELECLWRRARYAYLGIALDTFAALLVCLLIVIVFSEYFFGFESPGFIAVLFIATMLFLIGGLLAFLKEVFTAVRSLSVGFEPWNKK